MTALFDVFLSFKLTDADGRMTRDSALAREVYEYLTGQGLRVFCSSMTLEQLGVAAYARAIDDALDQASVLIAIGTSRSHLEASWVRYEWDSFFNDIRSGIKPDGRVFVYLDEVSASEMPRALRQTQILTHGPGQIEKLHRFVTNSLGYSGAGMADKQRPVQLGCSGELPPDLCGPGDGLRSAAVALVARGERHVAVALLTEQVKRQRVLGDQQGQVRALLALAHVVSLVPGKAKRALELAGRALRIGRTSGNEDLVATSLREIEAISESTRSERRSALGRWVQDILAAESDPPTSYPRQSIGADTSRAGLVTRPSLQALIGAWEWVTDAEMGRIACDGYARYIGGRLWMPYSFGDPSGVAAIFYGFQPMHDVFVGKFKWFASPIHGYTQWRIHGRDLIVGEWWYASDANDPTLERPPAGQGFRIRFVRAEGKTVPPWAEDVFDEICLLMDRTSDA